ncbi:MAG: flagellar basal body P-ring protein FlgI [Planctomycetes bacterium]|nr:flagellar basal body P-ring protein FlgI [Planctomycetota bacterium]
MRHGICLLLFLLATLAPAAHAQRIGSFCRLLNADPLEVGGIGIVTGLNGTGDSAANAKVMLQKMFEAHKYNFSLSDLKSKNIAIVRVDASIHPFARPGDRVNVRVSSIGDATDLNNGTLMATSLRFNSVGEAQVRAMGRVVGQNKSTTGMITEGGVVLVADMLNRTVIDKNGMFRLILNHPNYKDAMTVEANINGDPSTNPGRSEVRGFGDGENASAMKVAKARDAGMVIVRIPDQFMKRQVEYVSAVLDIDVPLQSVASIRINRSTGTAVISGDVKVMPGFISYQGRTVTLTDMGDNLPPKYTLENDTPRALVDVFGHGESGATGRRSLQTLVDTLAAMRCNTEDIINILLELKKENLIQAEIKID